MLIQGTLKVKSVCVDKPEKVAVLECSLGKFIVRDDPRLKVITDGTYDGLFDLERIEGKHGSSDGLVFLEIRATLKTLALLTATAMTAEEEEKPPFAGKNPLQKSLLDNTNSISSEDEALFRELWPLGNSVNLDASLPRTVLRNQAARLEQLGYHCDCKTQTWFKPEASL